MEPPTLLIPDSDLVSTNAMKTSEDLSINCPVCQVILENQETIWKHLQKDHRIGVNKFLCHQCARGFACNELLNEHSTEHDANAPCKCLICEHNYKCEYELKFHMRTSHSDERLLIECRLCGMYTDRMHFEDHLQTHFLIQSGGEDISNYQSSSATSGPGHPNKNGSGTDAVRRAESYTLPNLLKKANNNNPRKLLENNFENQIPRKPELPENNEEQEQTISPSSITKHNNGVLVAEFILYINDCVLVKTPTDDRRLVWVLDISSLGN